VDRAAGEFDGDSDRLAVLAAFEPARHVEEVVFRVAFLLPAVGVEVLPEVALLVHEADRHERQAQVARGFEVVPRQESEAP
jgi:hypothetical protein